MSLPTDMAVSDAEVRQRVLDYREAGFRNEAMPHIIFQPSHQACPWPSCTFVISGIDFQLELLGDARSYEDWMRAWWKGPGLVGRCPGCGNYVLFTMERKLAVEDLQGYVGAVLPDDWHQHAYLLS